VRLLLIRSSHRSPRIRVKIISTVEDIFAIPREFAGSGKGYEKVGHHEGERVGKSISSRPHWESCLLYDGYKVYRH